MTCQICGAASTRTATILTGAFEGEKELCDPCYKGAVLNGNVMLSRGGKRLGAGRPKKEPTKLMRVPVGAESAIKGLLELYAYFGVEQIGFASHSSVRASERLDVNEGVAMAFQLMHPNAFAHGRKLVSDFESAFSVCPDILEHLQNSKR